MVKIVCRCIKETQSLTYEQVMVEGNFPFIGKKTGAEPDSNGGGTPVCGQSGRGGEK